MDNRKYVWQRDFCKGQRLAEIQMQDEGEYRSLSVQNENKDRRKRSKLRPCTARGKDPNDGGHHHHHDVNKGKGKDVVLEQEVLHIFDEQQEMSGAQRRGKRVRGVAAGIQLHGTSRANVAATVVVDDDDHEVQILHASYQRQKTSDSQGKGKQVEEEALLGGDDDNEVDDCVIIDAERFRKAIEGKFAPVDQSYGEESDNDIFASLEMIENLNGFEADQDEPDTNKNNVEKGKEPIIVVDETEAGKEPVTGEQETERERIASRAKEKGKGIIEVADSEEEEGEKGKGIVEVADSEEEEGEKGKTNEVQEQQVGRSNNASLVKKPRLVWTPQLHNKFISAVQALGGDACPTSIHRSMNEPNLTRRHIATHLQQYRDQLRQNHETSAGKKAPSETPYNARYAYLPSLEVTKAMKKSKEIVDQKTKQMFRRHAYRFSRTPSFLAPKFSATCSGLNNYQVPITSAQTPQRLNSSSAQFTIDHEFNAANLARTSSNVNQNSVVNSSDGNLNSGAMGISDPASANVPNANKRLADFNLGDMKTDVPLTSAEATQRLNSSSAQFSIDHAFNAVNPATTFSNVNQNSDDYATVNPNPGYVLNADIFPTDPTDGNPDSGAMGISYPASANVPNADKSLTDFGLGDMETDALALRTTPVKLPSAYEKPISFSIGNQKSNEGAISNPTSGLETKTTMYSMKSYDVNQKLDATEISDPASCNVPSIRSLPMDCADGKEELQFMDNFPNLQEFPKECSDHQQEAGVMEISNPTRLNVCRIGSLLMDCTDGKEELDYMDNVPNLQEFLKECCDHNQEGGVMANSDPDLGNPPNADKFSANCNGSVREPNAMANANLTPGNVPYANISPGYSTNGNQELDVMAPSNHTAGYAHNSSNYRMDPANGTPVSFPPDSLSKAIHSESELADLWWLLKENSFDDKFMEAEPNQWDVDNYWESICNDIM